MSKDDSSAVPSSQSASTTVRGTPEVNAAIGKAIADEMKRVWQNDDEVIDSFGRVAAIAYTLGQTPRWEDPLFLDILGGPMERDPLHNGGLQHLKDIDQP